MQAIRVLKMAAAVGALMLSSLTFASAVNVGDNDVAIHGYDPVAYFTKSKAVKGSSKYTATYNGAIYQFHSADHRNMFKQNPERYAPQFGGYCAMGVVLNKKLDVDPDAFYVADNKLYLNLNKTVQKKWLTDVSGHIQSGKKIWNGIEEVPAAEVNAED
jgi:YHS domain-containing protein